MKEADDPDMAAIDAFRLADRQIGGGHLYAALLAYLNASVAPRLLTGGATSLTAAASLTAVAGRMAHDSGRDESARTHFGRAAELSQGDQAGELRGDVAAAQAHLELHLGDPGAAVGLARRGRDHLASGSRNPALAARLSAMEARGLAELGQRMDAARMLSQAEAALASRDSEASHWVAPFDEASLASETARCLHAMGDFAAARREAERVIGLRRSDRARSRAYAQLAVALALLCQPRPDPVEACAYARMVTERTVTVASVRIGQQLRQVRQLLQPHRGVREVAVYLETEAYTGWALT